MIKDEIISQMLVERLSRYNINLYWRISYSILEGTPLLHRYNITQHNVQAYRIDVEVTNFKDTALESVANINIV